MCDRDIQNDNHIIEYKPTVDPPIAKATISVTEVTVMETPACFSVSPIRSSTGRALSLGVSCRSDSTITNMSSTPIPGLQNMFDNV